MRDDSAEGIAGCREYEDCESLTGYCFGGNWKGIQLVHRCWVAVEKGKNGYWAIFEELQKLRRTPQRAREGKVGELKEKGKDGEEAGRISNI